jgi:hypothetical protein
VVEKATEATTAAGRGMGGLSDRELDQLTKLLRKLRIDAGDFPENV